MMKYNYLKSRKNVFGAVKDIDLKIYVGKIVCENHQ